MNGPLIVLTRAIFTDSSLKHTRGIERRHSAGIITGRRNEEENLSLGHHLTTKMDLSVCDRPTGLPGGGMTVSGPELQTLCATHDKSVCEKAISVPPSRRSFKCASLESMSVRLFGLITMLHSQGE